MMGYYGDWGWGSWLTMTATMLVTWGLIAWLALMAIRAWRPDHRQGQPDPRRILDERFAMGELTEDEYLRACSVLGPDRSHGATR